MHRIFGRSAFVTRGITCFTAVSSSLVACSLFDRHTRNRPLRVTCAGPAPSPHAYHSNSVVEQHDPVRPSGAVPRLVFVITRHGARTPINLLPSETPETFAALWGWCQNEDGQEIPCVPGTLTPLGQSQCRSLGSYLRYLYIAHDHLIPSSWKQAQQYIVIRSTDSSRTRMSAVGIIQGLFANENVPRDTIRSLIKMYSLEKENLFPNYPACRRVHELYAAGIATPIYQSLLHSEKALSTRAALCGHERIFAPHTSWINMADEFRGRLAHGLPLPAGSYEHVASVENMATQLFERITSGSTLYLHNTHIRHSHTDIGDIHDVHIMNPRYEFAKKVTMSDTYELLRMGVGPLWDEILQGMKQRISGDDSTRMVILSGHDVTIQPLIQSLRMAFSPTPDAHAPRLPFVNTTLLDTPYWPPFASMLQIELLQKDREWYVNIISNQQQVLLAPADVFMKHVTTLYHPRDYIHQCEGQTTGPIPSHVW